MYLHKCQNDNFAMIKYQIQLINHLPLLLPLFNMREKMVKFMFKRSPLLLLILLRARNLLVEGKGIRTQNGVAFVENMIISLKYICYKNYGFMFGFKKDVKPSIKYFSKDIQLVAPSMLMGKGTEELSKLTLK